VVEFESLNDDDALPQIGQRFRSRQTHDSPADNDHVRVEPLP
jgi:hypothetical protein